MHVALDMELWPLVDKEKAREKAKEKERAKEKGKEKERVKAKASKQIRHKNVPLLMRFTPMLWICLVMTSVG